MRFLGILIVALFMLSGCETLQVDQYSASQQNIAAIRNAMIKAGIDTLAVGEFTSAYPNPFESRCDFNSLVRIPHNIPPEKYIRNALINELKDTGVYSLDQIEAGRVITAHLDRFLLDNDNGKWLIVITVSLNTGDVYTVTETYEFDVITCERAASSLMPAIQDLIYKIVTHPAFQRRIDNPAG